MRIAVRLKVHWYPNTSWTGNDISFNLRVIQEYFEPSYSDKMMDKNLLKVNDHERTMALLCLKSKKHLNEIWLLIKSQPLLRKIVTVYIIKDLSKKEIHYEIYSYQTNYKTRRYNSLTKSSRLWSVRIQDSKSPPNNFSSNYAHLRFDLERLNKSQSLQSPVLWPI